MGKRSQFERNERDYYPTPYEAVRPLIEAIEPCKFAEPCAGDGRLISHLEAHGFKCAWASDFEPASVLKTDRHVVTVDAMDLSDLKMTIITNPPWERRTLHAMIEQFIDIARPYPVWLLFDTDWLYTKQSRPYHRFIRRIVPVGRVKWIEGSAHTGKDNCSWYCFRSGSNGGLIEFN